MHKWIHPTRFFYNGCNSLYACMQGLQLIHVNERGHQRAVCCGTLVGWVSTKRAMTYRPYWHICIAEITITQILLPQHPHTHTYSHSCVCIYKVTKTLFEIVSWQQKTETFSYGTVKHTICNFIFAKHSCTLFSIDVAWGPSHYKYVVLPV